MDESGWRGLQHPGVSYLSTPCHPAELPDQTSSRNRACGSKASSLNNNNKVSMKSLFCTNQTAQVVRTGGQTPPCHIHLTTPLFQCTPVVSSNIPYDFHMEEEIVFPSSYVQQNMMFVKAEMDYWCFRDPLSGATTSSIKG